VPPPLRHPHPPTMGAPPPLRHPQPPAMGGASSPAASAAAGHGVHLLPCSILSTGGLPPRASRRWRGRGAGLLAVRSAG
jgi:hypothetical protein